MRSPSRAHEVHGRILNDYLVPSGPSPCPDGATGPLGFPTSDETIVGAGRGNTFGGGAIYWTPTADAHAVRGAIVALYRTKGGPLGILGFPTTDESGVPDRVGRYNHFTGGSIYWSPATGAHEVHGAIRARWAALGWERSRLGYPTSNEVLVPGGRRNTFQHGTITWIAATGAVQVVIR